MRGDFIVGRANRRFGVHPRKNTTPRKPEFDRAVPEKSHHRRDSERHQSAPELADCVSSGRASLPK